MFKVLVLAYYFPPMGLSGVQRTLKFTKYMSRFNWEPTVITAGATGYFAHDESLMKEADEANIKIIRVGGKDPNSVLKNKGSIKMPREWIRKIYSDVSKTLFIPDNKKFWAKKAYKAAREELKKNNYDAIFVSSPPFSSFIEAVKLKEEFDLPLIVDYRDLWFGNHFAFTPTPYHKYKHKKLEDPALRKSDKVIVINRRIKERLLLQYPFLSFEDVMIIPQGYDPEDFEKVPAIPKGNNKLHILYSGIFYEKITPKYFLKAFKKLTVENPEVAGNIELHFVGHFRKENQKLVKKLDLQEFVKEHGYLDHLYAAQKIKSADVLWAMVGNGPGYETVSTGKLFEYFGTKKPVILCAPNGAAKSAAEEYGAAFIVEPDDVNGIKNIFIKLNELYKKNDLPVPNEEFVEKHNRIYLTEELIKQFQFFLKEV